MHLQEVTIDFARLCNYFNSKFGFWTMGKSIVYSSCYSLSIILFCNLYVEDKSPMIFNKNYVLTTASINV